MSAEARRGRTRDASNILYQAPPHSGFEGGVFRVNQRDTTLGLVHQVEPTEVRSVGQTMAAVDAEFVQSLPELPIPASGEPYDDCGEEKPLLFCERCGDPHRVSRRCRRAVCPACWQSWDKKQAVEIAAKVNGRQRYENKGPGTTTWMHHAIVSTPPGITMRSRQPLDRTKEVVKQIATEGGMEEGAIIYHPWRIDQEHRGDVLGHESGSGGLTWKDILWQIEKRGFEYVREKYLDFSPHFHVFGISEYFHMDTKGFQDRTGWVVKRVADDSGASIEELPDLCRAVGYSLSHAGLREDGRGMAAAYWYFGETANFEPYKGVRGDAAAAFNSISQRILGVSFPTRRCGESYLELVDATDEGLNEPAGDGGGGGGGGGGQDGPEKGQLETCGGRLIPMEHAPDYLGNEDWRAGAPHAFDLSEAYTEYRALVAVEDRPPPDPPPL